MMVGTRLYNINVNKTPAQAFTPPADEKKMGTIWIFVYYTPSTAQTGADAGISWS